MFWLFLTFVLHDGLILSAHYKYVMMMMMIISGCVGGLHCHSSSLISSVLATSAVWSMLTIITRAQLSLGLADRTHGAHSQPASITVRV